MLHTRWTLYKVICCKNCIVVEKTKMNEKEVFDGLILNKLFKFQTWTSSFKTVFASKARVRSSHPNDPVPKKALPDVHGGVDQSAERL